MDTQRDAIDLSRKQTTALPMPDPVADPLGFYLHAEFERMFAIEFPQSNSNDVRVRPSSSTHVTAGDRSPVARHLSPESQQ